MIIDIHAHLYPRSAVAAERGRGWWYGSRVWRDDDGRPAVTTGERTVVLGSSHHYDSLEVRADRMSQLGIDHQVLSLLPPLYRYELDPIIATEAAKAVNDELAESGFQSSQAFSALGTLPLQDVDASLKELDRVVRTGDLAGVAVGTHVAGRNWDDPRLFPLLEALADLECLVLLHPSAPRAHSIPQGHHLGNLLGNPWETTVAFASLVFSGVLDRLPTLRLCLAHGGGYVAFAVGRMDHGWSERGDVRAGVEHPPSDYLSRVYFDSLTHDPRALRLLLDIGGGDRVVLGTDFPADMGQLDAVEQLRVNPLLSVSERDAILSHNPTRLLSRERAA